MKPRNAIATTKRKSISGEGKRRKVDEHLIRVDPLNRDPEATRFEDVGECASNQRRRASTDMFSANEAAAIYDVD